MMRGKNEKKNPMEWLFNKEKKYLSKRDQFQGTVIEAHENSPREGFELVFELYDDSVRVNEFKKVIPKWEALSKKSMITKKRTFLPLIFKMLSGIRGSFKDLDPYFSKKASKRMELLEMTGASENLWNELNEYVKKK